MIDIHLEGNILSVPDDATIKELIPLSARTELVCGAYVNNIVKSLEFSVKNGDDVRMIDVRDEVGMRIYFSTLLLIFSKATHLAHSLVPPKFW